MAQQELEPTCTKAHVSSTTYALLDFLVNRLHRHESGSLVGDVRFILTSLVQNSGASCLANCPN